MLEKTLERHLDSKKIEPVNPKGNQPWIFIGRTDAEAEAPIFWPPDSHHSFTSMSWTVNSLEKILMLGKIEVRRRRGWQRMKWLDGITDSMDMGLSNSGREWRARKPGMLQVMGCRVEHNLETELKQHPRNRSNQGSKNPVPQKTITHWW